MGVQLNDISLANWDSGVPHAGGKDDESNLLLIVRESLNCTDKQVLDTLKGKVGRFLQGRCVSENVNKACQSLIGVKVRFKDGERYLSLSKIVSLRSI